ncbi:hypothetical protein ALC57_10862, partial [Trachymyrmex cornetzi]
EGKTTRKDGWTGELARFDEAKGSPKDGTKIHRHWPANCPQGAGSFHVGGSRVPGPNTFLIEMFIERLRRIIGKLFR